mmetsp:Transcript_48829/g.156165  ORF Transcript_48829/g.156165 Transcript_48829/m.156165 type:complete len:274 (-) Transcript_48829:2-823(-)
MAPSVALHDELVGPRNEREAIAMVELLGDVLAEGVAGPSGAYAPAQAVVRVAPKEVAHGALVRHFLDSVNLPHLVQVVDVGRETTVLCEYLALHERRQGEVVKEVRETLPSTLTIVLSRALVVETVDLCDLPALMVPSEDRDPLRKSDLETKEQGDAFHREVTAVDVVPQKEVIRVRRETTDAEELHEVMELPVDVSRNGHRAPYRLHIALRRQNLLGMVAKLLDLRFQEGLALGELLDTPVHVQAPARPGARLLPHAAGSGQSARGRRRATP